jgi:hypothetical protein
VDCAIECGGVGLGKLAHFVSDIRGHEELAMDYNSPRMFGCGG